MALCGCYYYVVAENPYHQSYRRHLPLLNSEAHTTILSTTSTTTLKQIFTNPSPTENIKECTYTFPLYDGVSVVGFTCKIGEKILTGLVKEKVQAKKIFDEAVAKGETAGFLEQSEEASDVFSTKLGNIPAGQSVIVEVTYIGELKHHETEGIRFTIPTSIAPRYGSGPTTTSSGPLQDGDGIKITVDVNMPEGSFIKGVQSPSHPIAVSMGTVSTASQAQPVMSKASATLSLGSAALEKDFVLIVQSKDVGIPKALLETHPTIPNHRAIMATLVPKFSLPPSKPEIVFLADRSGSMQGKSIEMLVSAMKVFLKSLPSGVKFNVGSFGSSVSFLWDQSKTYTSATLNESMEHIQGFSANMGGTETFNAVRGAIDRRYSDLPLEIILLTDGDIWRQEELFQYVNEQVNSSGGKIRVFPLGIGDGVSHALIEGLARAGNGFAQAVQFGERMDNYVVRMLRGALSPHITDYTLEIKYEQKDDDFEVIEKVTEGMRVLMAETETEKSAKTPPKEQATISLFDPSVDPEKEDIAMNDTDIELPKVPHPKLLQAPHKIPSLFAFSRTTVYILMSPETIQRNPTSVVLRATSAHGPLALEIPIEVLSEPAQTIHQLAAKKAVQDLEEGRGWIFDTKDQAAILLKDRFPSCFEDLVKREAVRLGEKFQVAGKWCSFVAVAANDKEIASKREPSRVQSTMASGDADVLQDFDFDSFLHDPPGSAPLHFDTGVSFDVAGPTQTTPVVGHYNAGPLNALPLASPSELAAYQQSLMVLNQSNKRRLMMARQAPVVAPGFGSASPPPPPPQLQQGPSGVFPKYDMQGSRSAQIPETRDLIQPTRSRGRGRGVPQSTVSRPPGVPSTSMQSLGLSPRSIVSPPKVNGSTNSFGNATASLFQSDDGSQSMFQSGKRAKMIPKAKMRMSSSVNMKMSTSQGAFVDEEEEGSESELTNHPVNWANKTSADKVLALIELQEFEGSWPAGNLKLAGILGFEIPDSPVDVGANANVWITVLVVVFLETKAADEEGTWSMVVEKAREWLGENVPSDLDVLEKAAVEVLGRN